MKFFLIIIALSSFSHLAYGQTSFIDWKIRVDLAVDRGLSFLAKVQEDDGSFPEQYGDSCGIPALAGMAFLSRGHLPTEGRYSRPLNKIIDYVLQNQNRQGVYDGGYTGQGPMYAHNIATLFLSEVSGMVDPERQRLINISLAKALSLILRAQAVKKSDRYQGGWRYHPYSKDSDTSCSGWALMALRSAKLNGAAIPDEAITAAVDYLYKNYDPAEGHFGYSKSGSHKESLTGMGLLCLELCGQHGRPETTKAANFILENHRALEDGPYEFYGNYYNAQAMFQIGGKYWASYADWMYGRYLKAQKEDGSWYSKETNGHVYGTCMMTLAFTVPYRQLPIYQRDETVDE